MQTEKETLLTDGARLGNLLDRPRMTATELAKLMGISRTMLYRVIRGEKRLGRDKLEKLMELEKQPSTMGLHSVSVPNAYEIREGSSPPQIDHAKIAVLEKQLAEVKEAYALSIVERDRLLKVVEDLATSIAGPRPSGQGRSDTAAPAGVPAVPASGALYKTRRSKSA